MKGQEGFTETTITNGKIEVMIDHIPSTGKIVGIYTYADDRDSSIAEYYWDDPIRPFRRWKPGERNEAFIHCPKGKVSQTNILKKLHREGFHPCLETEEEVLDYNRMLMAHGINDLYIL